MSPRNEENVMQKQSKESPVVVKTAKAYVKPEVTAQGSLVGRTLNSDSGADPEGFEDNIVWGN